MTKRLFLILPITLAACLLAGCTSFNEDKYSEQIRKWVPIGTPEAEAKHIMEHHGFDCELIGKDHPLNLEGIECLDCEKQQVWMHSWTARLLLTDGKVSGYADLTVEQ